MVHVLGLKVLVLLVLVLVLLEITTVEIKVHINLCLPKEESGSSIQARVLSINWSNFVWLWVYSYLAICHSHVQHRESLFQKDLCSWKEDDLNGWTRALCSCGPKLKCFKSWSRLRFWKPLIRVDQRKIHFKIWLVLPYEDDGYAGVAAGYDGVLNSCDTIS